MKLSWHQAHKVCDVILFPLWLINILCQGIIFVLLFPVSIYDKAWNALNRTIFWDLQGKSRDFEKRINSIKTK